MLLILIAWGLLFAISWPLALAVLIIWPIVWLVSLPFRFFGLLFSCVFALLSATLLLPARLLGWKPSAT